MQLQRIRVASRLRRQQAGDTIVEVLICIGIVSLVLTSAFLIVNKSNGQIQDSSEHAQASMYLQSQVELLHSYFTDSTATVPLATFCMYDDAMGSGTDSSKATALVTSTNCQIVNGGATYALSITAVDNTTYTFKISWDSVDGGKAQESYTYRDYIST